MTFEFSCQRVLGYVFLAYSVLYTILDIALLWYKNTLGLEDIDQMLYILAYIIYGIMVIWGTIMVLDHFCGTYSFRDGYENLSGDAFGKHNLPGLQKCLHTKTSCCNHEGHTLINLFFSSLAFVVSLLLLTRDDDVFIVVVFSTTTVGFVGNIYDTIVVCTDKKYKKSGSAPY